MFLLRQYVDEKTRNASIFDKLENQQPLSFPYPVSVTSTARKLKNLRSIICRNSIDKLNFKEPF